MYPNRGQCEAAQAQTVTENDLIKYCLVNAVKQIRLEQVGSDGKSAYRVHAKGTWDGRECLLITWRNKPREWSSLDRFVIHARDVYKYRGRILIEIKHGDESEIR